MPFEGVAVAASSWRRRLPQSKAQRLPCMRWRTLDPLQLKTG